MNDRILTREPKIQEYVLNMVQKLVHQVDLEINGFHFMGPHRYDYLFYLDAIADFAVDAKLEVVQEGRLFNGNDYKHHKCLGEKIEHITCLVYALSVFLKPTVF